MYSTIPYNTKPILDQQLEGYQNYTQENMEMAEQQSTIESVNEWQRQILVERYKGLASLIVELQSELEVLKLDIDSSNTHMHAISPLTDQQFEIFEKRIENHREGLCQFLYQMANTMMDSITRTKQQELPEPLPEPLPAQPSLPTSKISFSSMASSISSFFLSYNSDVETNDSYYDCLGSRAQSRRLKRQQLRHSYDQYCTNESYADLNFKANQSLSDISSSSGKYSRFESDEIIKVEKNKINPTKSRSCTIDHQQDAFLSKSTTKIEPSACTQQSQFKDIISYLNDIPLWEDDNDLCEDLLYLLEEMDENELSLTSITRPSPRSLQVNILLKRSIIDTFSSGFKWIKFVLVISLATVICLRRGICDSLLL